MQYFTPYSPCQSLDIDIENYDIVTVDVDGTILEGRALNGLFGLLNHLRDEGRLYEYVTGLAGSAIALGGSKLRGHLNRNPVEIETKAVEATVKALGRAGITKQEAQHWIGKEYDRSVRRGAELCIETLQKYCEDVIGASGSTKLVVEKIAEKSGLGDNFVGLETYYKVNENGEEVPVGMDTHLRNSHDKYRMVADYLSERGWDIDGEDRYRWIHIGNGSNDVAIAENAGCCIVPCGSCQEMVDLGMEEGNIVLGVDDYATLTEHLLFY